MRYLVKKLLTYNGRQYERGAVWEPTGHRNDAAIIRAGMVYEEKEEERPEAVAPPAQPSGKPGDPPFIASPRRTRGRNAGDDE